jgi:hypothetical protein
MGGSNGLNSTRRALTACPPNSKGQQVIANAIKAKL